MKSKTLRETIAAKLAAHLAKLPTIGDDAYIVTIDKYFTCGDYFEPQIKTIPNTYTQASALYARKVLILKGCNNVKIHKAKHWYESHIKLAQKYLSNEK